MPVVTLRAPLKDLAGGNHRLEVDGATVGEVLRTLESQWPKTTGWILDEHGAVRSTQAARGCGLFMPRRSLPGVG